MKHLARILAAERLLISPGLGFGEPAATEFFGGDAGHVGLDVEYGSAVEHVDASDAQFGTVAAEEFDDGECDWVGTAGRARSEEAVRSVVGRSWAEEFESL